VTFLFGIDAMPNLKAIAEDLPASSWVELQRPPHYAAKGKPRKHPENVKEKIVPRERLQDLDPDQGRSGRGSPTDRRPAGSRTA